MTYFLDPLSKMDIDGEVTMVAEDGKITGVSCTQGKSITLHSEYTPVSVDDFGTRVIPDVKRLLYALKCLEDDNIEFIVSEDKMTYKGDDYRFEFHFLDPHCAKKQTVSIKILEELGHQVEFDLSRKEMMRIQKTMMFARSSKESVAKITFSQEDDNIMVKIGDGSSMSDTAELAVGKIISGSITEPISVTPDIFSLVSSFKKDDISVKLNTNTKFFVFEIANGDDYRMRYITSAIVH